MFTIVPLFPGLPGGPELLIILAVIVLLFGANKIPKLARSTGQAMGEFRRGREEIEEEIKAGVSESEEAARADVERDDELTEKEAASA
jgi:sec-independent protein translocase protein TatA